MFFVVNRIKESILSASPFLLHVFMIAAVGGYTLLGAYIMQQLERGAENAHSQMADGQGNRREKRSIFDNPADLLALSVNELIEIAPGIHTCVRQALYNVLNMSECETADWIGHVFSQIGLLKIGQESDKISITKIDECYRNAEFELHFTRDHTRNDERQESADHHEATTIMASPINRTSQQQQVSNHEGWTFPNAVIFAFTLITTIGYGNLAPVTWQGQLFCIVFGFIGIPLALLTIADVGMFLNQVVKRAVRWGKAMGKCCARTDGDAQKSTADERSNGSDKTANTSKEGSTRSDEADDEEEEEERTAAESLLLTVVFLLYLMAGSAMIAS